MNPYLLIVEKLYNDIDEGKISFENAELVHNIAYKKYVNESFIFNKKKEIKKPKTMEELKKQLENKNKEVDDKLDSLNNKAKKFSNIANKENKQII